MQVAEQAYPLAQRRRPPANRNRSIEATVRTRGLLLSRALLGMDDHRLPIRVMSGELENAGKRGPGGGRRTKGRTA